MKVFFLLLLLIIFGAGGFFAAKAYGLIQFPDTQCSKMHTTSSQPPPQTVTAEDYFELGNYEYDRGDCLQAVMSYTQAVQEDPGFSRAYNNRAYTYMRMRNYKAALADLHTALDIDPTYVTALMNRGDIYNYYYAINHQKAVDDYNKVITLGKEKDRSGSVCGHKAMAQTSNLIPLAMLKLLLTSDCK